MLSTVSAVICPKIICGCRIGGTKLELIFQNQAPNILSHLPGTCVKTHYQRPFLLFEQKCSLKIVCVFISQSFPRSLRPQWAAGIRDSSALRPMGIAFFVCFQRTGNGLSNTIRHTMLTRTAVCSSWVVLHDLYTSL